MSHPSASHEPTRMQTAGIFVFVLLCGIPALKMNGFGFGFEFSLTTALACATVGGAVGGVLMCPRPMLAGLIGGLLAGPLGLVAVYFYTQHRDTVWNLELVIVQGIASLPGVGIGWIIKWLLSASPAR